MRNRTEELVQLVLACSKYSRGPAPTALRLRNILEAVDLDVAETGTDASKMQQPRAWRVRRRLSQRQINAMGSDYRSGLGVRDLARRYGVSEVSTRKILQEEGIRVRAAPIKLDRAQVAAAIRLYTQEGLSIARVASGLPLCSRTVAPR